MYNVSNGYFNRKKCMPIARTPFQSVFFSRFYHCKQHIPIFCDISSLSSLYLSVLVCIILSNFVLEVQTLTFSQVTPLTFFFINSYFSSFTCDVIARTAFGLDVNSQTSSDDQFAHHLELLLRSPKSYIGRLPFILAGQ